MGRIPQTIERWSKMPDYYIRTNDIHNRFGVSEPVRVLVSGGFHTTTSYRWSQHSAGHSYPLIRFDDKQKAYAFINWLAYKEGQKESHYEVCESTL